jgi:hypothetical protein
MIVNAALGKVPASNLHPSHDSTTIARADLDPIMWALEPKRANFRPQACLKVYFHATSALP